ncbi:MAG: pyridoxal 5'-phosphate synthase glutaminase subunit PdxT [Clostridiales bacterium]|nr:pyridoxal 5'-phosphate synthase glutaminase subunit PdxT [Clostridiales bacterium]
MVVAILALQGAFVEHGYMLDRLGAEHFEIRQRKDLDRAFDALILPGGESTVMGKLLRELDLFAPLQEKIKAGLPVFGTCAGLILLAKEVAEDKTYLGTMDIRVKRNAYGRQLGSFYTETEFKGLGKIPMTFIRAPYIESVTGDAEVLAEVDGKIVAARQGKQLVTAFHPELNEDVSVHKYFLEMAGLQ